MSNLIKRLTGRARVAELERQLRDQQKQTALLERLVEELLMEQRGQVIMPPRDLRMHVGARDSAGNFWVQGRGSAAKVIELFGTNPDGLVLDWGCGSGRTLYWLQAHEGWRRAYRGCDVDAQAIKWLRRTHGLDGVVEVSGDDPPLPYRDGQFSGLFCFSVLTHIHPEKHARWYRELRRVLKPGGRALLTVNGEGRGREAAAFTETERKALAGRGWIWAQREGHYKDAAVVPRAFTEQALAGLFTVEAYQPRGYHNMDVVIVRAV